MEEQFDWKEAKEGNEKEIERIVVQYYKLAFKMAYGWINQKKISLDEGLSLASLALMKCIRSGRYDLKKGKFSTYLGKAVDNEIRMFLRKQNRYNNIIEVSIDEEIPSLEGTVTRGECIGVEEDYGLVEDLLVAHSILDSAKGRMSEIESACMDMWLTGISQTEVAEELSMSKSYVNRLIRQGRRKIEEERLVYGV